MKTMKRIVLASGMAALSGFAWPTAAGAESGLQVWQVDSMTKVFLDAEAPGKSEPLIVEAARNEVVSAQFVVRSSMARKGLRCTMGPLAGPNGARIEGARVRYVGYVPIKTNSCGKGVDWKTCCLRPPPGPFPDPLLECEEIDLKEGQAQPVWITIHVPKEAPAGEYTAQAQFRAEGAGAASLPFKLRVYATTLPDARTLHVSVWPKFGEKLKYHNEKNPGLAIGAPMNDERFWRLVRTYASRMAAHRQDTIVAQFFGAPYKDLDPLVRAKAVQGGRLSYDFSRFDRYVKTFKEEGVAGVIESRDLLSPKDGKTGNAYVIENGTAVMKKLESSDTHWEEFLSSFLPALHAHLEEKGWLDSFVLRIYDEPERAEHYARMAALVKKHAPRLRVGNAFVHVTPSSVKDAMDAMVVILDYKDSKASYAKQVDYFRKLQQQGKEVWFYTCCVPSGDAHMNRFVDYALLKTRLLHWLNAKYGATGYLHWAWNSWLWDVYKSGQGNWPNGDEWIVYPTADGVIDSIRYEAMLEGIQDYELLDLLEKTSPAVTKEIMDAVVRSFTDYELDVGKFRAARRRLLEALSGK